jgi:iron complex transport system ATP-binding protein
LKNIIELKNITVFQQRNRVFNDFSLSIRENQNTVILGPNGSGKTTLMKLLNRELYIVENEHSNINIFGKNRWNVHELRTHLGVISQHLQYNYSNDALGLYVVLSGFYASDGIWQHQNFDSVKLDRADKVMELLRISKLKNRQYSSMSTGEQRKFLLARALVHDPKVLVFDEPTSGLDLRACFQYLEIIQELMNIGKKVILVTHHIHEIPPEISRVILLKEGRVFRDGEKEEVLTNKNLSRLFDCPIRVIEENGYYQALPG